MRHSKEYVFQYLDFLATQPIKRILLPDTLGILIPAETREYISAIVKRYPNIHFDFHAHNDYDLGIANVLEAVNAGAKGLHLTVNGMGERAGNAPLASAIAVLNDFVPGVKTSVVEKSLYSASRLVETFSGLRIPMNKPVVGENVFTQTAGIHADGDKKKNLYFNDLMPERFGRQRKYALGKTSGKANIENNLLQLGVELSDADLKKVTQRIIELGDKKETVTQSDLPYIISDVLDSSTFEENVRIEDYVLTNSRNLRPSATIKINIKGEMTEAHAQGDGQYDAFMNIPPGGKSDALCETIITWRMENKEFKTHGLDSDQTVSAIIATQKMLNMI